VAFGNAGQEVCPLSSSVERDCPRIEVQIANGVPRGPVRLSDTIRQVLGRAVSRLGLVESPAFAIRYDEDAFTCLRDPKVCAVEREDARLVIDVVPPVDAV